MNIRMIFAGRLFRFLCVLLAAVMATAPSVNVLAQTYGAQQAVRQRVQGLGGEQLPGEVEVEVQSAPERRPGDQTLLADPSAGMIDTTYISPAASAVIVLRPAQIMAAPIAQLLPKEVATAAGLQYLGFDPAEVEEVVAFVDLSNPAAPPAYGVTIKFTNPFRASAIPAERRAHAQLAEFNGKKYLQSAHPMLFSFYGPNNKTLLIAPDATLRQLVESAGQSKSGPVVDRVQSMPAGNDFYAAVDLASLRPLIEMGLAQAASQVPPDFQQFLQAPNLVSAAELTFNLSGAAPVSLAVHANDESAAQQLESLLADATSRYQDTMRTQYAEQAASEDPVQRAMAQYLERMSGSWTARFAPQREGATLNFFRSDGENAASQQFTTIAIIGILVALMLPAIQAAREAARRAQAIEGQEGPPEATDDAGTLRESF